MSSDRPSAAARQLRVPVVQLLREMGTRLEVDRSVHLEGFEVVTTAVREDETVDVALVLDSLTDGIVASGTVSVPWQGECRRCLDPVVGRSAHEVREVFTRSGEGDTYVLGDDELDLEPMVRDAAVLGLPLAPLCAGECRGPSPEEFPARPATGDAGPEIDPRWGALDALRFDDED